MWNITIVKCFDIYLSAVKTFLYIDIRSLLYIDAIIIARIYMFQTEYKTSGIHKNIPSSREKTIYIYTWNLGIYAAMLSIKTNSAIIYLSSAPNSLIAAITA